MLSSSLAEDAIYIARFGVASSLYSGAKRFLGPLSSLVVFIIVESGIPVNVVLLARAGSAFNFYPSKFIGLLTSVPGPSSTPFYISLAYSLNVSFIRASCLLSLLPETSNYYKCSKRSLILKSFSGCCALALFRSTRISWDYLFLSYNGRSAGYVLFSNY